jgi:hypothetical protein
MKKMPVGWPYTAPEGWVSCAERMPETGKEVQVAHTHCLYGFDDSRDGFGMVTGAFDGKVWGVSEFFLSPRAIVYFTPSHWRPLPNSEVAA